MNNFIKKSLFTVCAVLSCVLTHAITKEDLQKALEPGFSVSLRDYSELSQGQKENFYGFLSLYEELIEIFTDWNTLSQEEQKAIVGVLEFQIQMLLGKITENQLLSMMGIDENQIKAFKNLSPEEKKQMEEELINFINS